MSVLPLLQRSLLIAACVVSLLLAAPAVHAASLAELAPNWSQPTNFFYQATVQMNGQTLYMQNWNWNHERFRTELISKQGAMSIVLDKSTRSAYCYSYKPRFAYQIAMDKAWQAIEQQTPSSYAPLIQHPNLEELGITTIHGQECLVVAIDDAAPTIRNLTMWLRTDNGFPLRLDAALKDGRSFRMEVNRVQFDCVSEEDVMLPTDLTFEPLPENAAVPYSKL